jgi:hypothetical protein
MQENSLPIDKRLQDNPLELHLRTFATSLTGEGYAQGTVQKKLGLLADLGKWLGRTGRAVTNLDEQFLEAFAEHRQRVRRGELRTLGQFLHHLRERDVVPDRKLVPDQSPLAELLSQYEKYLHSERGLMAATISQYQYFIRKFLEERFTKGPFLTKEVEASDISAFVLRQGQSRSVKSAQLMTTALRSFFRYLFQRGELPADLAASVPAVANPRLFTLPRYMSSQEVERVLKACNCRTAIGRRDYAILLLLARLGPSVWVWSGASPSGLALLNLARRFQPQTFFLIVTGVSLLTSIGTRRSKGSFAKPNNSPLPRDSVPTRLQPSSVCL